MARLTLQSSAPEGASGSIGRAPGGVEVTRWKVLTHDWRPPVQGGDPLCNGSSWPVVLPGMPVDEGDAECGEGWNSCRRMSDALRIGGLWPDGRPSRVLLVEPTGTVLDRGDKTRSSGMALLREATEAEVSEGVLDMSAAFGDHAATMAEEQMAWREALSRPGRDQAAVEDGLRVALDARGLSGWSLRRYATARAARDAWDARDARDARAARAARDARDARDAWDEWDEWDAWPARDARDARAAWDAWDARAAWAAWAAWDAWDARAARAALTVRYASLMGWHDADLTSGLRDAYATGLGIALPVGEGTLGWAMDR